MHPLFGAGCVRLVQELSVLNCSTPTKHHLALTPGKTSVQKNLENPNLTMEKAEGADEAVDVRSTICAEHLSPSGTYLLLLLLSRRRGRWFYQAEVFKRIRSFEKGQEGLEPSSCCPGEEDFKLSLK